ncbi:magnesium/cobalt transporter CorA [Bythopirellula polymerisocia]|uniref:Magnesium transport protein CorA n=1 Tax=Bythopirellula polymerisocia TaxID=2528003 RepID=A0A5C6CMP2_9BACT|nr:magnesium/cobalt transporter CorA [Bythopirellula polymerisocia]TWU24734.1 Magnesium transport protein CorA [Bythopirellula polymerisocia]
MFSAIFDKRHPQSGARPGTLVIPKEAPAPRIHMIRYSAEDMTATEVNHVEELKVAFDNQAVTWIDIQGYGDKSLMQSIGDLFELHPLLLEDVVNIPQRPKTEAYGDQLLTIVRMVRVERPGEIDMEQVSIVLCKNYVLTFQERYGDVLDPVRRRIRSGKGVIRQHRADFLAYTIADTIIDGYYPVLEQIGEHLIGLEDIVVTDPTPELLIELNQIKNRLINLRRGIWPQREAVNAMVRGDHPAICPEVRIYLRDTYDHCVQTSEVTEMYREMVTGLMNTYLSSIANRTNEVMKVLTIMASIFIPLTFLAGIYGMNFEHMPELHVEWAYPAVWITMLGTAVGMLTYFWRKGWISFGTSPKSSRTRRKVESD